jgi:hypothetical protein
MVQEKVITDICYQSYLDKMLSSVGKKGCKNSEKQIRDLIGHKEESDECEEVFVYFSNIDYLRGEASNFLRKEHIKSLSKDSFDYDKHSKKLNDFRKSLITSQELMRDKIIKDFLIGKANRNPEIDPLIIIKSYSKIYEGIRSLALEMELSLDSLKQKGRTSLKALHDYVYELASLYQKLSSKKFTVFRNIDGASCKPVSPGHDFVYEAIQLMNEESKNDGYEKSYTDKNIYNACEKAQKSLKNKIQKINNLIAR